MKKDIKMVYAQSSDIKSRTYLEYRKDMKKKAIVELEVIDWLSNKLSSLYKKKIIVKKSGGDAYIWFLRNGGITGDSDFKAYYDDKEENFELQYSDRDNLDFFDFKVSKVGKKIKNKREPYKDKKFIYILKPSLKYCIIEPEWIITNGIEAGVPAWGNRTAFRIPSNKFKEILNIDTKLEQVIKNIDIKINLLNFQFNFIKNEEDKLSKILESVIDKEEILKIIPKDLDSFYKVCFLIDRLNKIPENSSLWLIYLLTFYNEKLTSYQMAQLLFCIDFLYSKIQLKENEITKIVEIINRIKNYCDVNQKSNGIFETSINLSQREELRNFIFIINLLEDLIQDSIYYYNTDIKPINKIFESIKFIEQVEINIKQIETDNIS